MPSPNVAMSPMTARPGQRPAFAPSGFDTNRRVPMPAMAGGGAAAAATDAAEDRPSHAQDGRRG